MLLSPGKALSHYRLIDKIGEGGMGVVYRAEDTKLRRQVALKVLPPGLVGDEERRLRFMREARTAAAVNHPNIATIHEVDEVDGVLFIAMELVHGKTLRSLLRERPLTIPEALRYGSAIARGLSHAHRAGVIHRDLKPENVIVGTEGLVKILDFGLAKLVEEKEEANRSQVSEFPTATAELTQENRILGTVQYMSPEQAKGRRVDSRTDLFSFGITLYEMVTGKAPFRGRSHIETLGAILHEPAVPASRLNTDVPVSLERVIGRCLEKDPDRRYQETSELVADLDRVERETELPPRLLPILRRFRTVGRRATWPALLFGSLALLALGTWYLWPPPSATSPIDPNAVAVLPFSVEGGDRVAYLANGMVDLLSAKLDGAGELRGVDPRSVLSTVRLHGDGLLDAEGGREIAGRLGAGRYVLGGIVTVGKRLHVNASLYDAGRGAEPVALATAVGEEGELLALVDNLAADLLTNLIGPENRLTRIGAMTTDSFDALKAFLVGESLFNAGQLNAAVAAYQRAVDEDPGFALAHYRISEAASVSTDWNLWSLIKESGDKAYEHRDRLPPREQRLVEAQHTAGGGDAVEAIGLFRDILGTYPDDMQAWGALGDVLYNFGKRQGLYLDEAREAWERVLFYDPDDVMAVYMLGQLSANEEKYDEVIARYEHLLEIEPAGDYALQFRTIVAFGKGDRKAQERAIDELRRSEDLRVDFTAQGVAVAAGKFEGAARIYRLLIEPSRSIESRADGHLLLALLSLTQGRWRDARESLAEVEAIYSARGIRMRALLSLFPILQIPRSDLEALREPVSKLKSPAVRAPLWRAYLLGRLAIRLGDPDAAAQHTEELEAVREGFDPEENPVVSAWVGDLVHGLRAELALSRGSPEDALAEIEKTRPEKAWLDSTPGLLDGTAYERYIRGMLLEEHGRHQEALRWYGTLGVVSPRGFVYLPAKHVRMGEIFERLGENEKAVRHYARFVELWRDCDPEQRPLVDEIEARLGRLRPNRLLGADGS